MRTFHHSVHVRCTGAASGAAVLGSGVVRERIITVPVAPRLHVASAFVADVRVDPSLRDDITLRFRADDDVLPFIRARFHRGAIAVTLEADVPIAPSELSLQATVGPLCELAGAGSAQLIVRDLGGASVMLAATGASRIDASGRAREWKVVAGGSSRVALDASDADRVLLDIDRASEVRLHGRARELDLHADGSARVYAAAPDFEACVARVRLAGAAKARLRARDRVEGRVRVPARLDVSCDGQLELDGFAAFPFWGARRAS